MPLRIQQAFILSLGFRRHGIIYINVQANHDDMVHSIRNRDEVAYIVIQVAHFHIHILGQTVVNARKKPVLVEAGRGPLPTPCSS